MTGLHDLTISRGVKFHFRHVFRKQNGVSAGRGSHRLEGQKRDQTWFSVSLPAGPPFDRNHICTCVRAECNAALVCMRLWSISPLSGREESVWTCLSFSYEGLAPGLQYFLRNVSAMRKPVSAPTCIVESSPRVTQTPAYAGCPSHQLDWMMNEMMLWSET